MKWTDDEINYLKESYTDRNCIEEIALVLNRTVTAVRGKIQRLGLNLESAKISSSQYKTKLLNRNITIVPVEPYKGSKTRIDHKCIKGHVWKAFPSNILQGSNCPYCKKGNLVSGILYYIKIDYNNSTYYKIGITTTSLKRRFSRDSDKIITPLMEKSFTDIEEAKNEEARILALFKSKQCKDYILKSGGNTELFIEDVLDLDL